MYRHSIAQAQVLRTENTFPGLAFDHSADHPPYDLSALRDDSISESRETRSAIAASHMLDGSWRFPRMLRLVPTGGPGSEFRLL